MKFKEAKLEFELKYWQELFDITNGNITKMSKESGKYRADIYDVLKRLAIHIPPERQTELYTTYFIQAENGFIKIGKAIDAQQRLSVLQIGMVEKLRLLATTKEYSEKALHQRFAAHRVRGEWFTPSSELLEFIESVIRSSVSLTEAY